MSIPLTTLVHTNSKTTPSVSKAQTDKIGKGNKNRKKKKPNLECYGRFDVEASKFPDNCDKNLLC